MRSLDAPIEIVIGTIFLYHLLGNSSCIQPRLLIGFLFYFNLGVSCFFGLAVTCLFLPMNHYAGKVVVGRLPFFHFLLISIKIVTGAQEMLMNARDERVALMNEASFKRLLCHLILTFWLFRSLVESAC